MDSFLPDGNLADLLDIVTQNYYNDYRSHWHLDAAECPPNFAEEDWLLAKLLDRVGERVLSSAHALSVDPELAALLREHRPLEMANEEVGHLLRNQIAQARAELELAGRAISRLFEGKKRLTLLLSFLSRFELSNRAAAYVDRMVECYIWGLDTECAIMARSVLETALEEVLPDDKMASLGFRETKYGFTYWQYCEAALNAQLISEEGAKYLNDVRRDGNAAVHESPGLHPPAAGTVTKTILCLRELFPAPSF